MKRTEKETKAMLRQYEKECYDVEQMQKRTFSANVLKVLGKYENKLEKEQLEEIEAKLSYDRVVAHFDELKSAEATLTLTRRRIVFIALLLKSKT